MSSPVKVVRVQQVNGFGPNCSICGRAQITVDHSGEGLTSQKFPLARVLIEFDHAPMFVVCQDCEPIARLAGTFRHTLERAVERLKFVDASPPAATEKEPHTP